MALIPERIVEKTWQEVAGFSADKAKKEMIKLGRSMRGIQRFIWGQEITHGL